MKNVKLPKFITKHEDNAIKITTCPRLLYKGQPVEAMGLSGTWAVMQVIRNRLISEPTLIIDFADQERYGPVWMLSTLGDYAVILVLADTVVVINQKGDVRLDHVQARADQAAIGSGVTSIMPLMHKGHTGRKLVTAASVFDRGTSNVLTVWDGKETRTGYHYPVSFMKKVALYLARFALAIEEGYAQGLEKSLQQESARREQSSKGVTND